MVFFLGNILKQLAEQLYNYLSFCDARLRYIGQLKK